MFFASSVTISTSIVTKEAFGQNTYNPVSDCFDQNGSKQDLDYLASRGDFEEAIPKDQVLVSVAKSINLPMQTELDLSNVIERQKSLSDDNGIKLFNEISNLLASSGFTADQQNNLNNCFSNIPVYP